jgi:hypothetical protein
MNRFTSFGTFPARAVPERGGASCLALPHQFPRHGRPLSQAGSCERRSPDRRSRFICFIPALAQPRRDESGGAASFSLAKKDSVSPHPIHESQTKARVEVTVGNMAAGKYPRPAMGGGVVAMERVSRLAARRSAAATEVAGRDSRRDGNPIQPHTNSSQAQT